MLFKYVPREKAIKATLEEDETANLCGFVADLYNRAELDFIDYEGFEMWGNSYGVHVLRYADGGKVTVGEMDIESLNEKGFVWLDVVCE